MHPVDRDFLHWIPNASLSVLDVEAWKSDPVFAARGEQFPVVLSDPLLAIENEARKNLGAVLKHLGLWVEYRFGAFECRLHKFGANSPKILIHVDGRWECDSQKASYGWNLTSLVMLFFQKSLYQALQQLKRIVAALRTGTGYERLSGFEGLVSCDDPEQFASVQTLEPLEPPCPVGPLGDAFVYYPVLNLSSKHVCTIVGADYPGTEKGPLGYRRRKYHVLTPRLRPDGSAAWLNVPPSGAYPLYGMEQLANDAASPVVVISDPLSIVFGQQLLSAHGIEPIAVCMLPCDDSLDRTDFSCLHGRQVYFMGLAEDVAARLDAMLCTENRRTRVRVVKLHARQDKPDLYSGEDGLNFVDLTAELTLREFCDLRRQRGWTVTVEVPPMRSVQDVIEMENFQVVQTGIFHVRFKEGETIRTLIASRIDVIAHARNADSAEWGIVVEFADQAGVLHQWCIPRSMAVGGQQLCQQLLGLGAYISPSADHRQKFLEYLLTVPQQRMAISVSGPGWHRDVFVMGDGSHIGQTTEMIAYQTSNPSCDFFGQSGTLQSWNAKVGVHGAQNSRIALAIGVALAGPWLQFLGEENGGFHVYGDSSCGKTTAAFVTGSVWGPPEIYMTRWRATGNGIEARAVIHNDTVLVIDELSQSDPVVASEGVYMIANGQGKARAQQDGTARKQATWRNLFFSTGEIPLEVHMASAGKKVMAGQQTRLIDLAADTGSGLGIFDHLGGQPGGEALSRALKDGATHHHGTLGRAYVRAMADPTRRVALVNQMRLRIVEFVRAVTPNNAHGQVMRSIRRFALVAASLECAVDIEVLHWQSGQATAMIKRCCIQWLEARGGAGNAEADQALQQLRRILAERGESGFTEITLDGIDQAAPQRVTVQRLGFRALAEDGHTDFYILPDPFKSVVCAGMTPRQATKDLVRANALVTGLDGKPQVLKRLPGMGTQRVYHVRSTVLDEQGGRPAR
jgi:uncharacterized protein (DUF927 family)